jgi:hypothetical protein
MTKAWSRQGDAMNHMWHGDALASPGQENLISPDLVVSATEAFTIGFKHHYTFEVATGGLNADGGILEISSDGGTTWQDISMYADPMYTGALYTMPGMDTNPYAGKQAFVGRSAGYPNNVDAKLDLGMKLAGKTVKLRFVVATDEGTSGAGWDVDDIAFTGITNSPFTKVVDNAGTCGGDGGTPTDGGARDGAAGAGGTGGSGGSGGSAPPPTDSCDCSVPGGRSTSSGAGALVGALGAMAMLLRRRRRQS